MLKITIPLTPVSKKNSQQILINKATGRPFIMPSKRYKEYENDAMHFMPKGIETIAEPVNVKCMFYMPTKRKVDLTNLLEAIDDILVKAGVLEDDHSGIVVSHDGSRVLYDKERPRTEVEIESIGGNYGLEENVLS